MASMRSNIRKMNPHLSVLCLVVFWLCSVSVGQAFIGSVEVVPPLPTDQDSVSIHVSGCFSDGCWEVTGYECTIAPGGAIEIDIFAVDHWFPTGWCIMIIVPYALDFELGVLPAGDYEAAVVEHHYSLREPEPDVRVLEFEVRVNTPVKRTTWGAIRALYR